MHYYYYELMCLLSGLLLWIIKLSKSKDMCKGCKIIGLRMALIIHSKLHRKRRKKIILGKLF